MNPAMLQYLQQLYGQRAMPGGVANMPAQNVPLGGQTNWMNPPQLADDSGMYGPTLSTLFGQAGATGAPNMVNGAGGYWAPYMGRPQQGPPAGYGSRGMSQPRAPADPSGGSLGFNGHRPGGYMLGNQGPMPGGQTNWMPGNQGRQPMPRSQMPTRPVQTGPRNWSPGNNGGMQPRIAQANNTAAGMQQRQNLRRLSRNSTGM